MKSKSSLSLPPRLSLPVAVLSTGSLLLVGLLALEGAKARAQETFIAYAVPVTTVANQTGLGAEPIGMDFDVANEIVVTRLGVFDSGGDGFVAGTVLTARIWDRSQEPPKELAALEFTPENPGELVGGSRFKPLTTPLRLPAGFQGTMAADGWTDVDSINNSFGDVGSVSWTLNGGQGSVIFVGASRYGGVPGDFPPTVDTGPAARFAAGTFEFQTTALIFPGKPNVSLQAGDKQIVLSWPAITQPAAAAKYRVSRSTSAAGPFTQIAEITELTYTDGGLVNGTAYSYLVAGVSAAGQAGLASDLKSGAAYQLAANHFIAYFTPGNSAGNRELASSFGMDFDVQNPVIVKRLGVFDEYSDGLQLPLGTRIFNRDTQALVAEVLFTPEDPGELIEGMRFKALAQPLRLEAGFHGVIEADGFGPGERFFTSAGDPNAVFWTLNDGKGSVLFVGTSRSGSPASFPDVPYNGGLAARFTAGTFEFEALPPEVVGVPQVTVTRPFEDAAVTLNWLAVTQPLPAAKYEVQRATATDGPYTKIGETTASTYRDTTVQNGTEYFYKVRAVAAGGQTTDSLPVSAIPNAVRGGIAYIVPAGLEGNQALGGGSVGMDFDVGRPIKVTKLGVFDDGSDGLKMTLTAVLYDRAARKILATQEFTTSNQGELIDGSRFLTLPEPVVLDVGFQGSMVIWYSSGSDERLFNRAFGPADLVAFDGGSLTFVGLGRYGSAGSFPSTVDTGPFNRYAGGTFAFEPTVIERPTFIAYAFPANTAGNQDVTGAALGYDFDVANDIIVTRLGVFDENSDGLKQTIVARLWDRQGQGGTPTQLASIEFTPADAGELIAGSRFKPLSPPLRLPRGFQGTISTDGYGALEKVKNSHGNTADVTWTLNDGNGSIAFVGSSRYGAQGEYPATADGGPAARFAAGTFEFQTTPPALPGQPAVTVQRPTEDGAVTLNWLAVTAPLPATKYEVLRATAGGQLAQIGETTALTYRDTTVQNGTSYSYAVRAIGAGGEIGENSLVVSATPNPRQAGIAYIVPAGTVGNQDVANTAVGMDFDVAHSIKITKLGVFDDSGDGLNLTITASIYDRTAPAQPVATLEFTTASPGDLIGGSRFKSLPEPLTLNAGFQGSIVVHGYSVGELLFNTHGGAVGGLQTFDGGSLLFVGSSRYGAAGQFPNTADGGPVNRYAGGTFEFEPVADLEQVILQISRSGANLKLTWNGSGVLERTETLGGGWQTVANAVSGVELPITGTASFFRVRR